MEEWKRKKTEEKKELETVTPPTEHEDLGLEMEATGEVVARVVQKILTFLPNGNACLSHRIGGTKKKIKLLGYHLRVPQAPLF